MNAEFMTMLFANCNEAFFGARIYLPAEKSELLFPPDL
jgi:hypothetical protein